MPEESSLRKYECPKVKLSRLLLDNRFLIFMQNLLALENTCTESVLLAGTVLNPFLTAPVYCSLINPSFMPPSGSHPPTFLSTEKIRKNKK